VPHGEAYARCTAHTGAQARLDQREIIMNDMATVPATTELAQAAADRRIFGRPELAANAEFKVIAEALRELVTELRLVRMQLEKFTGGPPSA
jgi:hypothetical protein